MLTRFAPAPTGLLHLGHVANAIFVWGLAAREGAGVLLRVEDHDRQRSRVEHERALLDDLDWLAFLPTHFPTDVFRAGPCESRQSDREALYERVARELMARNLVYGCDCSRQRIARAVDSKAAQVGVYSGTCRDRGLKLSGRVAWRLRIDAREETFDDLLVGWQHQMPALDSGDPVIRDRSGNWTYQFAVTVDDHLQGIDLVVRGRDLLRSTFLQMQIARLIGRPAPAIFAHHPLIMKTPTQKLSKSDGDTGIRALRSAGWTASEVVGLAAWRVGLTPAARPLAVQDVPSLFIQRSTTHA